MSEQKSEIVVEGDVAPWRRAMIDMAQSARGGVSQVEDQFGGLGKVLEGVQGRIAAIGAVVAGGAVFGAAVNVAAAWTQESVDLAAALGMSASAAGDLKAALAAEGVEVSSFVGAGQKLAATLRTDEAALRDVGLVTRDAAGHLRPLNELTVEAVELVGQYKAGTDRAMAAQVLFGKGFEINGDLAKINSELIAENTARQRELASTVTEEGVAAFEAYEAMGKQVQATIRALQQSIGNALMPVLTDLGNWFSAAGPAAITIVRGAIGGLAAAFHGVTNGVVVVWETVNAFAYSVAEPLIGVSSAISLAMAGNFEGAANRIAGISTNIASAWSGAFDRITASSAQTSERLWALFGPGTEIAAPGVSGRSANALVTDPKKDKDKPRADPGYMPYYEAALAQEQRLAAERDALREYTKAEELAYWQTLLQHADLSTKDRLAIERKAADLTVAIRRDEARQRQAVDAEHARSHEVLALGRIDAERVAAQSALNLDQITKGQFLQMEQQFEVQRHEIQRAALEERLRLLALDPNLNPLEMARIKNQLLELEQQHQIRLAQLRGQAAEEMQRGGFFEGVGAAFGGALQSMLTQMQTWRQAVNGILTQLRNSFLQNLVIEPMQQYIAGLARMLAQKLGFLATETAATTAASAAAVGTKVAETTVVGTANGIQAGTGALAAMSAIPIVGPALGIAAMAAMIAAATGALGGLKSAAGGYDIPAGINPLTQLHAEEMVLPASIANPLRQLVEGGGGERRTGGGSVVYNDYSGQLTRSQIRANARMIADELSRATRDGWRPGE